MRKHYTLFSNQNLRTGEFDCDDPPLVRYILTPDELDQVARGWFGYGAWTAPYWFIGVEPGGDEAAANLALWEQSGRPELMDITSRHSGHKDDWFGPTSHTQSTWARLIWLLLTYEGIEPTSEATLDYQRKHLGRLDGKTALLELSPFAATDLSVASPRTLHRDYRISALRDRMLTYSPDFVVFYSSSADYADSWAAIAETSLDQGRPVLVGTTACVMASHPQHEWGKAYWQQIGEKLRQCRGDVRVIGRPTQ